MRRTILIGLALLAFGCGDDSSASHTSRCAALGDPDVSCRFVGRFAGEAQRSTVMVRTAEGSAAGSLELLIGPRGGRPQVMVWAYRGPTADGFSGDVYVSRYLDDVFDYGTLDMELVAAGRRLRMVIDGGSFFPSKTFEGVYVGR